jgi:superfamily II DNA/RNA helicase
MEFTPSRRDRSFAEKRALLRELIRAEGEACTNAIIFCNRKIDVDTLAKSLKKHGFDAAPIHGDLDQSVRTRTLDGFRDGSLRYLIASDVAARGLDIPAVSHVFNFDVPSHAEDYVHRIGRTGRAGRKGKAYTLATPSDEKYLAAIEHMLQSAADAWRAPRRVQPRFGAAPVPERSEPVRGRRERRAPASDRRGTEATAAPAPVETPTLPQPAPQRPEPKSRRRPNQRLSPWQRRRSEPRSERQPRRDDRRDDRRRNRDDAPVVGMGDHVPEFLLREFRAG